MCIKKQVNIAIVMLLAVSAVHASTLEDNNNLVSLLKAYQLKPVCAEEVRLTDVFGIKFLKQVKDGSRA